MAAGKLTVLNLGTGGVDVDTDPLLMKDENLRQAQNLEHRAISGRKGAIGTRSGFAQFITQALAGAVLGGIEMPVAGTGGAPPAGGGGGGTGTPIPHSSNDPGANLGPGLTIDNSPNAGGSNPPGPNLGQGNLLFGGGRILLVGMHDTTVGGTQTGYGWFVFPRLANQAALISTTGSNGAVVGPPGHPVDVIRPGENDYNNHGQLAYTFANNVLFYSEAFARSTSTSDATRTKVKLRRYDGKTDTRVFTFPHNELMTGENYSSSIVSVIVKYGDGNTLYVAIADAKGIAGGATGYDGRVFQVSGLDSQNYSVTELFNSRYAGNGVGLVSDPTTNPYTPYALEFFGGNLWVGMYRGALLLDGDFDPYVFKLNVAGTPPLVPLSQQALSDHTTSGISDASVMKRYQGSLYIGTREAYNKTGGFTYQFAKLFRLDPDNTLTAVVDLGSYFSHTARSGNLVSAIDILGSNLYVAIWNSDSGDGAQVLKFDGTTWTSVLTVTNCNSALNLAVDDGVLYAYGRKTTSVNAIYVTTDGTSWTDQSANFTPGAAAKYQPMPFFYGVNQ